MTSCTLYSVLNECLLSSSLSFVHLGMRVGDRVISCFDVDCPFHFFFSLSLSLCQVVRNIWLEPGRHPAGERTCGIRIGSVRFLVNLLVASFVGGQLVGGQVVNFGVDAGDVIW